MVHDSEDHPILQSIVQRNPERRSKPTGCSCHRNSFVRSARMKAPQMRQLQSSYQPIMETFTTREVQTHYSVVKLVWKFEVWYDLAWRFKSNAYNTPSHNHTFLESQQLWINSRNQKRLHTQCLKLPSEEPHNLQLFPARVCLSWKFWFSTLDFCQLDGHDTKKLLANLWPTNKFNKEQEYAHWFAPWMSGQINLVTLLTLR